MSAPVEVTATQKWCSRVAIGAELDGCWRWTGAVSSSGYGDVYLNGRRQRAHRVGYEMFVGPIAPGLTLDHLCRNRWCVNPEHLEPVTNAVNVLRGDGRTARLARRTHCAKGHPLSGDNLIVAKDGRRCRICRGRVKKPTPVLTPSQEKAKARWKRNRQNHPDKVKEHNDKRNRRISAERAARRTWHTCLGDGRCVTCGKILPRTWDAGTEGGGSDG